MRCKLPLKHHVGNPDLRGKQRQFRKKKKKHEDSNPSQERDEENDTEVAFSVF